MIFPTSVHVLPLSLLHGKPRTSPVLCHQGLLTIRYELQRCFTSHRLLPHQHNKEFYLARYITIPLKFPNYSHGVIMLGDGSSAISSLLDMFTPQPVYAAFLSRHLLPATSGTGFSLRYLHHCGLKIFIPEAPF